jgi:hypothetical protein
MKAKFLVVLCAIVALIALTWRSPIGPVSKAFAQQGVQPAAKQETTGIQPRMVSPTFAGPPAGTPKLPIDLFSSKNFYKDRALWSDQRYFRCNTPRQITDIWTSHRIGEKPPTTAAWGDCSIDYPRAKIVSPYPYKTAREHYQALLAAAKAKGGPTVYTKATLPDWDGHYARDGQADHGGDWIGGAVNQAPTILSLLTPEYQTRMVQGNYHEGVNNSPQWNASFCYPEGYMRWWLGGGGNSDVMVTTWNVQFLSGLADNFIRQILIGKEHVQKVPQWYGETVGFWDGTTLVAWTANVQGWTLTHSMFDFSDKMETVETYKPAYDASGKYVGLDIEGVFYDPDAFAQPLHATFRLARQADDPTRRYTYVECLSNLKNTKGMPTQITEADPRYVDYYGRPWAQNWEKYFEVGWDKPQSSGVPQDILDSLK